MLEAAPAQSTTLPVVQATQPATEITLPILAAGAGFFVLASLTFTGVAWALGAFRPRPWPARIDPDQPVWPLAAALGVAIMLLLTTVIALTLALGLAPVEAADAVDAPSAAPDAANPVLAMQVSAISYIAAVAGALALMGLFRTLGFRSRLGLSARQFPRGVMVGGIAVLLVMPWMWASGAILQLIRFSLGYPIDATHSILQAILDDPDARTIAWGVISALVVAPVAEEILFRGLLQTSLVHGLHRIFAGPPEAEVVNEPAEATDTPIVYSTSETWRPLPGEVIPQVYHWVGIVLASMAFALLHEPWSVPLIFILSLMLGYIYERTGTLWAPVTVHFVFNAASVLLVLMRI